MICWQHPITIIGNLETRRVWSIGVALDHYFYQIIIPHNIKPEKLPNKVEFRHQSITNPSVTPEYHILRDINMITVSLKDSTTA